MKKRILLGVLAACLILALVSCNDEGMDSLANFMGKMGNNVYGIKPDMKDVAVVTGTISNSVSTAEDGSIKIDLDSASSIIQKLAEIGTSNQKIAQAKEDLKAPIVVEGKKSEEIQQALKNKIQEVSTALPDSTTIENKKVKSAVEEVTAALNTIKDNIPAEPTQADLATVVIINSLATEVQELSKTPVDTSDTSAMVDLADKALAALDALKVTTEAADIDILKDFNITSLLSSSESGESGHAVSKATGDDLIEYAELLNNSFGKVATLISTKENGVYRFDEVKYKRLILQMSAFRSTYEIASLALVPAFSGLNISNENYNTLKADKDEKANIFEDLDDSSEGLFALHENDNLTMNDFALYLLSFYFTEMDISLKNVFDTDKSSMAEVFKQFIVDNEEALKQQNYEKLNYSAISLEFTGTMEEDLARKLANKVLITARTSLVISLEALAGEALFYKILPRGNVIEEVGVGKWLSNIMGTVIRTIDAPEEGGSVK